MLIQDEFEHNAAELIEKARHVDELFQYYYSDEICQPDVKKATQEGGLSHLCRDWCQTATFMLN